MRSEGYGSWVGLSVCLSVCLSVKSYLTYRASVHPENAVTSSAGNVDQKICGDFSENTLFRSYGIIYVAKLLSSPPVHDVHRSRSLA